MKKQQFKKTQQNLKYNPLVTKLFNMQLHVLFYCLLVLHCGGGIRAMVCATFRGVVSGIELLIIILPLQCFLLGPLSCNPID